MEKPSITNIKYFIRMDMYYFITRAHISLASLRTDARSPRFLANDKDTNRKAVIEGIIN